MRIRRSGLGLDSSCRFVLLLSFEQLPPTVLVVAQDSQPVENRSGIPEDVPGGPKVDGAFELVVESDGSFTNLAISKLARNDKELEVEGEPLDRQQGESLLEHLATEKLQSSLGIADIEVEE